MEVYGLNSSGVGSFFIIALYRSLFIRFVLRPLYHTYLSGKEVAVGSKILLLCAVHTACLMRRPHTTQYIRTYTSRQFSFTFEIGELWNSSHLNGRWNLYKKRVFFPFRKVWMYGICKSTSKIRKFICLDSI